MNNKAIKNIIFDLGNVIIDIDPKLTLQAFAHLSKKTLDEINHIYHSEELFEYYEKGLVNDAFLRTRLREILECPQATDQQIDHAWNALLLDIPLARIELVKKAAQKYRVFILSNTNHIHATEFHKILEKVSGHKHFKDIFEKVYYSFHMQKRKFDADIYEQVLKESRIKAEETLFIDDNHDNILTAKKLGIQVIHHLGELTEITFFKSI